MRVHVLLLCLSAACASDPTCKPPQELVDGKCIDVPLPPGPRSGRTIVGPCTPGASFCAEGAAAICSSDGQSARATPCLSTSTCIDGKCVTTCTPGASIVCSSSTARSICNLDGLTFTSSACPTSAPTCLSGACLAPQPICTPNEVRCEGDRVVGCSADGFTETSTTCDLGCAQGQCQGACGDANEDQIGCEFVVVKLDNLDQNLPFAVTISNVTRQSARVRVLTPNGRVVLRKTIAAESLERIALPMAVTVPASSRSLESLRIESDTPITVHQFNPVNNVGAFSNDASLLLPANVGGTEYWVVGWETRIVLAAAYATIVATEPGRTRVEVTPRTVTVAGPDVPELAAGVAHAFVLSKGEVLSIGTQDMTGTRITSDQKITVFTGHKCANVPPETTFCDHVEEQLLPVRLWGTQSIVAKLSRRGSEPDVVRVIASSDGTTITTTPPIAALDGRTLSTGEHLDAEITDDVVIEASRPVLVSQFMVGSGFGCAQGQCAVPREARCTNGATGVGDPSHLLIVPTSHFANEYLVLVPDDYADDFITVTGPALAEVRVDRARLRLTPIPGTALASGTVQVSDGLRRVESDLPIGLYVYGYDCDVSYGYPGGLR